MTDERYWMCIIGPAKPKDILPFSDSPMRNVVQRQFKSITGQDGNDCWSGWGLNKERKNILNYIWSMDNDDPLYNTIKNLILRRDKIIHLNKLNDK